MTNFDLLTEFYNSKSRKHLGCRKTFLELVLCVMYTVHVYSFAFQLKVFCLMKKDKKKNEQKSKKNKHSIKGLAEKVQFNFRNIYLVIYLHSASASAIHYY